jgi:hypothetical protein
VTRRRPAALAIVVGLGLAFAAARLAPLRTPPLYDGVVPDQPYIWLDPPPNHPGNPSSNSATIAVNGSSPLTTLATKELNPQAQMFAPPGGLKLPADTKSITVSIKPVEPQAQPTDGHVDGNVYEITVVNQAGMAATADPSASVTVVLRATDPTTTTATIEQFVNGAWTPLKTDPEGFGSQFLTIVTTFGDFAVVLPGPAPTTGSSASGAPASGPPASAAPGPTTTPTVAATPTPAASAEGSGSSGSNITLYAAMAIGVILVGLAATAFLPGRNQRGRNRNRGWSDKPPPRTRR